MQGAQSILLGDADVVVAGGMESMSNVPFYNENLRWGNKYGNVTLIDGLAKDGLTDVYHNYAMGNAADMCAKECNISREAQDEFAIESYKRSQAAWDAGKFDNEIVPVEVPQKKGDAIKISKDEDPWNVKFDKIPGLRPAFSKEVPKAVAKAGLKIEDINYFELNEAFSVVGIVNSQKMNLDPSKVNPASAMVVAAQAQ
eukprot:gene7255-biopygen6294